MDDTSGFGTPMETTDYATSSPGYTDPISSFFGGIFFIIILVLILIFVVIFMFYRGVSWVGSSVTGGPKKEGFELPKTGAQPCPEHDERCAHFPSL